MDFKKRVAFVMLFIHGGENMVEWLFDSRFRFGLVCDNSFSRYRCIESLSCLTVYILFTGEDCTVRIVPDMGGD